MAAPSEVEFAAALRFLDSGNMVQAEAACLSVPSTAPEHFDALQLLGAVAVMTRRPALAVDYLDRALALKPDHAGAHSNRGNALLDLKQFDDALANYDRALALLPDHVEAHFYRGNALVGLNRHDEALKSYDCAIAIRADYVEAHLNRGNALAGLNRLDEALKSYDRALAIKADYVEAHLNRGVALAGLNRPDEALKSYDRALALKPDNAEAEWNRGLLYLLLGNFECGWRSYEWRGQRLGRTEPPRAYPQPLWLGDADLHGKRILLWSEQGFGDSLQFCRYVTQVAALGAVVILEAPAALAPLLNSLAGVAEFIPKGSPIPAVDFHCPLLSLPLAFGTTLDSISGTPYLAAPPERIATWHPFLGDPTHPRVGLSWSGSMGHKNDLNRSIPLPQFAQGLFTGVEYIQLQKDVRAADRVWLDRHPEIRSFDGQVNDFGDTAALIASLDLVITVDTSVAHLAGAMGKAVWVLLPFAPDWRWLLDRSDSPWYDSATLFRQPGPGDWDSVLAAVRQALAENYGLLDPGPQAAQRAMTTTP